MVITLDSKLEAALNEQAKRKGVSPEVMAVEALRDRLLGLQPAETSADDWVQRLRAIATDCGVSLSNAAVSSEGIYE